jgi:transcriptional regulator with XRE-family HTH domain
MANRKSKDLPAPTTYGEEFGHRIRDARVRNNLTQGEVAEAMGLKNATSLTHMETGRSAPRVHRLAALADALGVSLDWLLRG